MLNDGGLISRPGALSGLRSACPAAGDAMDVKRSLTALVALAVLASVFAIGPAAASADDCTITQANQDSDVLDVDADANAIVGNAAANVPVLSPGADSDATANSVVNDGNDNFGQQNSATCEN